jgi:hypothetical protein
MATFSATYVSTSSFTVSGDVTEYFPVGVMCRVDCSGWAYGSVASSSFSSPNTTVTLNEAVLSDPCGNAEVSVVHPKGVAIHDHSSNTDGGSGVTGTAPEHEWSGKSIRFKDPDGTWGSWVDLSGEATLKETSQTAGENLSEGHIVYKKSADSKWYKAQNDGTEAEADGWGVVTESGGIDGGAAGEITLIGIVGSSGQVLLDGSPVWLSSDSLPTTTKPTSTNFPVQIGFATGTDEYFFIPPKRPDQRILKINQDVGENITAFRAVYSDTSDSGEWKHCDGNGTAAQQTAQGIALETQTNSEDIDFDVALPGSIIYNSGWSWTSSGTPIYLSDSGSGQITESSGTNGNQIGIAIGTDRLFFWPIIKSEQLIRGGAYELDGDKIDIDVTFDSITPDTSPGEVDNAAHLGAILKGIENYIKNGIPIKITGTAGETLAQYEIVYQDTTDSGEWKKADADTEATLETIGIVTESGGITDTNSGEITLFGTVTNGSWTWTPGAKLYLSGTAGDASETAGTNERVIGYALTATQIIFNPQGASGGGGSTTHTITAGETLAEFDAVYLDTSDNSEAKKGTNNGTEAQADIVGIITESGGITDTETGEITLSGPITRTGGWAGLSDGWVYLGTSGALTNTPPTADDTYVKPVGFLEGDTLLLGQYIGWKNETSNITVVITGTAGEALSQYDLVYSDTSDSGEWKKTDSDTMSKAAAAGIVLESGGIANGSTGSILRWGIVTNGAWSFTRGALLYPSSTAGGLSETMGAYGYVIGQVDSESANTIFFNPQLGSVS